MRSRFIVSFAVCVLVAFVLTAECFASGTIKIEHNRTRDEVVEKHLEYPHSGFGNRATRYGKTPILKSPYSAGSLNGEDVDDALNALKMVKFLAGVPYENVEFTDEYNNISQHGAVLLAASNQFTHTPGKPIDMAQEFYDLGYKGCYHSNLNAGRNNISGAVLGFVFDSGQNNISHAGHRRWVLNPDGTEYGIGFAAGSGTYGGYRISMYVRGGISKEADSFVAWPSSGAFPIQYFAASNYISSVISAPWSINLGAEYAPPSKKTVVVRLTRERDGKVWMFDSQTPDLGAETMSNDKLHLSVDNMLYGMKKAIIFRPDQSSLGVIEDGDRFTVEVSGLKLSDGTEAVLSYSIDFFDIEKAVNEYTAGSKFGDTAYIPTFPVTMNGVTVDNENLKYPFILFNDITYFPMTYNDSRFLGIATDYNEASGLSVYEYIGDAVKYKGEKGAKNPSSFNVSVATGKITVNGKAINNFEEEYPLLLFRDVTYFPMTWRFGVEEFGWSYSFDIKKGLVIDTRE